MRSQLFLGFPSRIAVSVFSRIMGLLADKRLGLPRLSRLFGSDFGTTTAWKEKDMSPLALFASFQKEEAWVARELLSSKSMLSLATEFDQS